MNAVITAATGYTQDDLQPFLRSLSQQCTEIKVFLIAFQHDRENIEDLQAEYPFIEPIYISKKSRVVRHAFRVANYPLSKRSFSSVNSLIKAIGTYPLHIALERYFVALRIVKTFGSSFTNFLLTDSRDVVIQKNPFALINGKLISGFEEKRLGECPFNSSWIQTVYGDTMLNSMLDRQIICSGVTLGPTKQVEEYLSQMCSEIWRMLPKIACGAGFDQSIHNYLIYQNKIALDLTENREGFIATVGYENRSSILTDPVSSSVRIYEKYPAIVHQYDRHPDLLAFFRERLLTS